MKGLLAQPISTLIPSCCMSSAVVGYKRAFCADDSVAICHGKEGNRHALSPYLTHTSNILLKTICCVIENIRVAL
ncbi:MAG: hypothetical protein WCH01_10255, partial [Methylococcaceae bacterium]